MSLVKSLSKTAGAVVAVGVLGAAVVAPVAGISGMAVARTQEAMSSNLADLTDGEAPGVTTILDSHGTPMAWLYRQRRFEVGGDQISPAMKQAIVSVEDRRFYEHDGVDWQGTIRAMATNIFSGSVQQGASTLDQQYVKNYLLLVDAEDEAEQAAATETSYARKLREMRMASDLEQLLTKDEILTRYLNIVPFGNGAYGVEAAAQTYFGVPAVELDVAQSAMLAGIVQSSSVLNPYTNEVGVTQRRNTVIDTMVATGSITPEEGAAIKQQPLGVLPAPNELPRGCIAAGNRGFFCDHVLRYLEDKGIGLDELETGAYTVETTLDPVIQDVTHDAVTSQVDPMAPGVAEVMDVVEPGEDDHPIRAMVSSRNYGLNLEAGETVLPQTSTRVGNGAGSVFKIFTAAAALEKGMGVDTMLDVPTRHEARNLGTGGAENCPPDTYCVENAGVFKPKMTLKDALAHSPNTTFVKLIEMVGVSPTVDMAVKLGLRDYAEPGSFDGESSIADYMKDNNLGSFTLGPTAVNPLELANVAATVASGGVWCEPNPIVRVTDRHGRDVTPDRPDCERVLDAGVAHALEDGLSQDVVSGTAADAARAAGWSAPTAAKTGTTESHQSAAFMGFNSGFAAAPYIYNDGTTVSPLCTGPLRQCPAGNLYGGMEAARTWFNAANRIPAATGGRLGPVDARFRQGTAVADLPKVSGMSEDDARRKITAEGYTVRTQYVPGNGMPLGRAVNVVPAQEPLLEGGEVILQLSDGSRPVQVPPVPAQPPAGEQHTRRDAPDPGETLENLQNTLNGILRENGF
ncbi:transglycosylase domain-containing protein [Corynebacterium sp. P7202]|uniref:Transglycosylase domain-containing protein n=1 Tax=Corynebacterium pygosceleis TaxID=2800406 RepID=A0A9Q4C8B9_9CORY|nr:transglycosylase domain-containing protein [Corynebacterium pygosceleis]MCK7637362.1 transglycosylase domain-containing protein [Corynebacterium pygosceleis]MCX7445266.1 transglycosylase domain-containing protein [Corynebacterium pygosceleis]MCX7468309.1 transglycosylase domain-containing protein [Corynebacterium pygosceleis]